MEEKELLEKNRFTEEEYKKMVKAAIQKADIQIESV